MIAGVLGVSLLTVLGASQLIGHRGGPVPVVQADPTPFRVKPANPGGLQISGTNEDIFAGDNGSDAGKLAPPPEVPEPQALRAQALRTPPPAAAPARLPAAALAPVAQPAAGPAAAVQPARAPAPVVAVKPAAVAEKPVVDARPAPAAVADKAATDKKALVQLAALGTEEAAKAEWDRLQKRMPELLNGHKPAVSKIDRDGHAFWRLRTGGFTDAAEAAAFCEHVRAKGGGCSVADF